MESIRLHETHATTNDICICTDHNDSNNSNLIQLVVWWSTLIIKDSIVKRI